MVVVYRFPGRARELFLGRLLLRLLLSVHQDCFTRPFVWVRRLFAPIDMAILQNVFHRISCARINRRNRRNRPCMETNRRTPSSSSTRRYHALMATAPHDDAAASHRRAEADDACSSPRVCADEHLPTVQTMTPLPDCAAAMAQSYYS
jgi:hypothetical protein